MDDVHLLNYALRMNGIILDESQLAVIVKTVQVLNTRGENFSISDAIQVKENARSMFNDDEDESNY